jgi:hypothetical protein
MGARSFGIVGAFVLAASAAVTVATSAGATTSTQLTRYPYLTDLVGSSVEVNWGTDRSSTKGSARWAAVDSQGNCTITTSKSQTVSASRTAITVNGVAEYQWAASLSLPASGTYCYRVYLGSTDLLGTDPSPRFTTQVPSSSSQAFSFDVFGDWGQAYANGNADQANLMQQIKASGATFAVSVGDNGYPAGSQTNYGDLQQTGQDISAVFGSQFWPVPGPTIPLFPASGNHGFASTTSTRTTEQINWPESTAVSTSGGTYQAQTYCCLNGTGSATYPSSWYAFNAGNARFYVLEADWSDSNLGTGTSYSDDYAYHWAQNDAEYQWLSNDLAAHPGGLKFAFWHYPMYSDQKAQNSDTYLQGGNSLEGLLSANNVSIGFSGHAHLYERNSPVGSDTFPTYITGGGGALLEPIAEVGCSSFDAYGIGWSPTKSAGSACGGAPIPDSAARVFHFLKVSVNGNQVTVTPTDELGRTFDVQTYDFSTSSPPDTIIDSAPSGTTKSTSASVSFHSTQSGSTFQCQLDSNTAASCTSPVAYSGLADGVHTVSVAASNNGLTDPTPATATWTVDTTAPSAPSGLSAKAASSSEVDLTWNPSTDANGVASYNVIRNGSPLATVNGSTLTYRDLSVAGNTTYQYTVSAVDVAGNVSQPSNMAAVTTPSGSATTTVNLPTLQAAYVYSGSSTTNYGSTDPLLCSASSYRTFLEFDTSAIPAGATITGVELQFTPAISETSGGVEVHPEASGWSQSTVTWANQPAWNTAVIGTSSVPTSGTALFVNLPVSAVHTGSLTDLGLRFTLSGVVFKIKGASNAAAPVLSITYTTS